MNRSSLRALLLMLPLGATAVAATPPQYSVIDLGVWVPGQGLLWQGLASTPAPSSFPGYGGIDGIYAGNSSASVGFAQVPGGGDHAARWVTSSSGTTFTDLGLLPNAFQYGRDPSSIAYSLNLVGDVVGQSDTQYQAGTGPYHSSHAFLWNSGVMTDLGAIGGNGLDSQALGVNDLHEIVGWTFTISSVDGSALQRAFVYIGGTMSNLTFYEVGGPNVLLEEATGIDCQGNISAYGYPASQPAPHNIHNYLLVRQGAARTNCLN